MKCKVKEDSKIGLIRNIYILMHFNLKENFVNMMSKNVYYITAKDGMVYQMKPLIYNTKFNPGENTT